MPHSLNVLMVGQGVPQSAALDEAQRLAGNAVVALRKPKDLPHGLALAEFHLILVDEPCAEVVRTALDEVAVPPPLLVLCEGPASKETLALVQRGAAHCTSRDDANAIASAFIRAAHRSSPANEFADHRLEDLMRERTRALEESHQRLRLSERMAAMGTLSTGIGHDIGNLVLPLRIGLEALESRDLPADCEPDLSAIRKAVEYLQGLANGLRYLAMDPDDLGIGARHNDLGDWWGDVKPLLENTLPREVELVRDFSDDLPYVSIPLHHLTQIVFNLVQNAGEAMRRRGAGEVRIHAEASSDQTTVRLSVIDNGPGMAPDVRERCLEPFFTTKFRGVRTGLGLPLVHGLLQKAGGEIDLETEPDRGTKWTLTLPAKSRSERLPPGSRPNARVDLTDHRIRAYVTSVLKSLDFDVGEDGGATVLRVTEPGKPLAITMHELLDADEALQVVLFGHSQNGKHPRLHEIGPNPSSSAIRGALRDIRALV